MLDKLITYIVCWYKTFYQVLPVARTNRITTSHDKFVVILVRTTGSTWYKVLYHHTMYVMGMYFTLPVHLKERNYYCTHMLCTTGIIQKPINVTYFSHFWDRPVPIFSDVRFSYLALVQDKKNHVRFTGKCMLYSLCQLPPQFSMLFLFKINNSLYISFLSFINTQILTICHIIT
jgi:hypothetical protein